jgi:phytol kinase
MFPASYWAFQATSLAVLYAIAFVCGLMVLRWNVRVNYTRKINHFALFFLPMYIATFYSPPDTPATTLMTGLITIGMLSAYAAPLRARSASLGVMFSSFDRPEDRPNTLWWLQSQVAAGYAVAIPLAIVMARLGHPDLMLIPILINGIGDGLAEPVGVRFGRHRYTVRPLTGKETYTRSYEGSACVLITGFIIIALFREAFTPTQFWTALATVPLIMTLTEAWSPHTWDTPFLFLTGGLTLTGIITML